MKQLQIIIGLFILTNLIGLKSSCQDGVTPKVTFTISKAFWNVKGTFNEIDYSIQLNPNDLENSKIEGKASISNINTYSEERDQHLQAEEWFNATIYQEIIISSVKIESKKNQQYTGLFDISIKGISKEKSIPFQIVDQNGTRYLVSEFTISLEQYNIGDGAVSYVVGDKVKVLLFLPF